MEGKGSISEYRSKLDRTLASPDLINDEMVHTLVKNQILQSSCCQLEDYPEYVVERRSKELSNFLSMLRSASARDVERSNSSDLLLGGWRVKQDTEELRVMYQEGPEGTPFHTLLAEGYVDGPVDVCICISSESDLYKKWWPQTAIPTFRIISSHCVKKVRVGEQIALVRMKVSWPLSSREALVHYFTFEYFQDGLIVVLINTISDSETINRSTHGFTPDGIPDAQDVVRIDVVGGFALQKVAADRSYFRTIANMDLKLDFVPPAFINFISRQLIGSGFKLYKKEVASVSKGDENFLEALKDPLCARIRRALYSQDTSTASPTLSKPRSTSIVPEEQSMEAVGNNSTDENKECNDYVVDSEAEYVGAGDTKLLTEIEEFEEKDGEGTESLDISVQKSGDNLANKTDEVRADKKEVICTGVEQAFGTSGESTNHFGSGINDEVGISPAVQQALQTLEKAISIIREHNSKPGNDESDVLEGHLLDLADSGEQSFLSKADQIKGKNRTRDESPKIGSADLTSLQLGNISDQYGSRPEDSNSLTRETNQSKIVPASPDEDPSSQPHIVHIDKHSSLNQRTVSTLSKDRNQSFSLKADSNSINVKKKAKKKNKESLFCCLHF